jgi:hypothetical protein
LNRATITSGAASSYPSSTATASNNEILNVAAIQYIQGCGANGLEFVDAVSGAANNNGVDGISTFGPSATFWRDQPTHGTILQA